jgi:hypothetical protein
MVSPELVSRPLAALSVKCRLKTMDEAFPAAPLLLASA